MAPRFQVFGPSRGRPRTSLHPQDPLFVWPLWLRPYVHQARPVVVGFLRLIEGPVDWLLKAVDWVLKAPRGATEKVKEWWGG